LEKLALAAGTALCLAITGFVIVTASADPVDDTLEFDGAEMITRAPAPEGHPFEEVLSGWLFREAETRATQEDSFENPGMLAVERGPVLRLLPR
jgi:L-cysteine S-thiosulfotransferase